MALAGTFRSRTFFCSAIHSPQRSEASSGVSVRTVMLPQSMFRTIFCVSGGSVTSAFRLVLPRDDLLFLLAELLDAERDDVAGFEELRRGLHAKANARRRAGDDDVARIEDHELRTVPDQVFAA